MSDFDWKKALTTIAPALAAVVGGPAGIAIGALGAISKALFGTETASEAQISEAVRQGLNPEQILALKQIEADLTKAGIQADLRKDELVIEDRVSARQRDTAIAQAGHYNFRADVLAFLAVGGLVVSVWFIARDSDMPERAVNAIMFVAGVLASAVRDVYGFEFGSSRSSAQKDQTISKMLEK